jgi:DNA-binding PadR family transcriptional regulator
MQAEKSEKHKPRLGASGLCFSVFSPARAFARQQRPLRSLRCSVYEIRWLPNSSFSSRTIDLQIYRQTDIVAAVTPRSSPDRQIAPAVFHILIALADGPRHGYGIMQDVVERTSGRIKMSPGTLYGSIKQMLEEGLIEEARGKRAPDDDERRRYYRISASGREAARREMSRLADLLSQARVTSLRFEKG